MFRQHFQSTDSFQFNCKKFPYITVYIYIYDEIWYISKFLRKWKSLHVPKFQRTIETTPCQSFQRKGKLPDETETKKRKGGSWMNDCDDTAHVTCAQSCHLYHPSYEWPNSLFERNFVLANDEFLREDWISRNSSRRRINSTNSTQTKIIDVARNSGKTERGRKLGSVFRSAIGWAKILYVVSPRGRQDKRKKETLAKEARRRARQTKNEEASEAGVEGRIRE